MEYKEIEDYIYSQLPIYHRIGPAAYKADLTNIQKLCEMMSNPQNDFKAIHITGTNGKGTVSNLTAAILQLSGYKVGLLTSPHLKDLRERIKVNGRKIRKRHVIAFFNEYMPIIKKIKPSFFELITAMAFYFFREQKIDIAVVEVGMGGRLDSTNVVNPILSVITNVDYDHTDILGNTLEKIATEKAGIIKENVSVVIGRKQKEIMHIFENIAKQKNAKIIYASDNFKAFNINYSVTKVPKLKFDILHNEKVIFKQVNSSLKGIYQTENIITTLQIIEELKNLNYNIGFLAQRRGITKLTIMMDFQGRWQFLSTSPKIVVDIAHNPAGIREVVKMIEQTKHNNLHIVFGCVNDKDVNNMLNILPVNAEYYFCKPNVPRGMDIESLSSLAKKYNLKGKTYFSVEEALKNAKKNAESDDLIVVCGSTFVVAEVLENKPDNEPE